MKKFVLALIFFCFVPVGWTETVLSVNKKLEEALLCNPNPIEDVRDIAKGGSNFREGYATHSFGQGTSYRTVVILEEPISIAGSTTRAVVAETEFSNFDFNGVVYAEFLGNYKKVVEKLSLSPRKSESEVNKGVGIGVYERSLKIDIDGKPYDVCPMVITLTPIDSKRFLLGCGWCNG